MHNKITANDPEIVLLVLGGEPVWEYEKVKVWVGPDGHIVDAHVVELDPAGTFACMTLGCSGSGPDCRHKAQARAIVSQMVKRPRRSRARSAIEQPTTDWTADLWPSVRDQLTDLLADN